MSAKKGRPPGSTKPGAARELIAVRLTEDQRALAAWLGWGNTSAGLKAALDAYAQRMGYAPDDPARPWSPESRAEDQRRLPTGQAGADAGR